MRKAISLLLCIMLAVSILPANMVLATEQTEGIFTYTVENGEAKIWQCSSSVVGAVVIPAKLGGVPVTSIMGSAFRDCSAITSVVIPDGVVEIGYSVFAGCSSLSKITIPDSVTVIRSNTFQNTAFYNDQSNWENGVLYCGKHLIKAHPGIRGSYTIKDGTIAIADEAFWNCRQLGGVIFPDSVRFMGNGTFFQCINLSNVILSENLTSVGDDSFAHCSSLSSIRIPDKVTTIGMDAFAVCEGLGAVVLPKSVKQICSYAFDRCEGITKIYYTGNEEQWNSISVLDNNDILFNGEIIYNYQPAKKITGDVTAKYRSDLIKNASITFPYTDEFFVNYSGYIYNHKLARATLGLELSAFTPHNTKTALERTSNIRKVYEKMGFPLENIFTVNYDKALTNTEDKAAYTIASKPLYDGSTLIAVVVRGGGYGGEWRGNFHVGSGAIHTGFGTPANDIYSDLEEYISDFNIDPSNTKIWITGYSRGAAIANIVAGKINENQLINGNNLYAYLFAVPNGVLVADVNAHDSVHDNIYNIVLPYDVVPKVAMEDWGYGRYGKTLTVKNKNPASDGSVRPAGRTNYRRYYQDKTDRTVENYFKKLTGKKYSVGLDQTIAGGTAIDALVNLAKNQEGYVTTYQAAIMDIVEGIICCDSLWDICKRYENRDGYDEAKKYSAQKVYELQKYIKLLKTFTYNEIVDYLHPIGIIMYMNGIKDGYWDLITNNLLSVAELLLVIGQIGTVADAHNPEYYISWLYAFDDMADIYDSGTYNKLMIACPVDVNIYNAEGEQVVSIVRNEVMTAQLPVVLIGESAEVYLEGNAEDYIIQISAYDEGTVNYSITEYEDFEETRKINYSDIPVKTDDVLTGDIPQGQGNEAATYQLTKNSEEMITCTEELSGEALGMLSVHVSSEGDGVGIGVEQATKGELVTLSAIPSFGAEFTGWYNEENKLLSQDEYYSFIIRETMNVVAKFTDSTVKTNLLDLPSVSDEILTVSNQVIAEKNISGVSYIGIYDEEDRLLALKGTEMKLEAAGQADNTVTFDLKGITGTPAYLKVFLWDNEMSPLALSNKVPIVITE